MRGSSRSRARVPHPPTHHPCRIAVLTVSRSPGTPETRALDPLPEVRMAASARHETRALLRAHLAAASGYRHLTPNCPVCRQLLRLAMEPSPSGQEDPETVTEDQSPSPA
jgi:hypothetical protein